MDKEKPYYFLLLDFASTFDLQLTVKVKHNRRKEKQCLLNYIPRKL